MTNIDALKALYVTLGGNANTVASMTVSADVIYAMSQLSLSVTPELPEVKAADNGKVLKVVDGKWAVGPDATE